MIRFHDTEFNEYNIDPVTAEITDLSGNVQDVRLYNSPGYYTFKGMHVHVIQMNTNSISGYIPELHIHHIDKNPLNNALSNLRYVTPEEHRQLHGCFGEENPMFGIPCTYNMTDEEVNDWKQSLSNAFKGKVFWNDGVKNVRSAVCPRNRFCQR